MNHSYIFISALKLDVVIGVYAEERVSPQTILLDIELTTNLFTAGKSDKLADTIDYAKVVAALQKWAISQRFQLVEALAHYLVDQLLECFQVSKVQLRLSKFLQNLSAESVGVVIAKEKFSK